MKYILTLFVLLFATFLFAQDENVSVSLNVTKNKIEIGAPLEVTLSIDYPVSYNIKKIVLPLVTDSAKLGDDIEIWETQTPFDTLLENNKGEFIKHYEQHFTIATFKKGIVDLNPLFAIFDNDTVVSNALIITTETAELEENAKLKNIKPLIEDPFTIWEEIWLILLEYWIFILLGLLIPIIGLVIYFILKNKPEKNIKKEIIPLNIRVLDRLNNIEQEKLWQNSKTKTYYSEVTNVVWLYLSERYQVSTFEKTSSEILNQLKMKPISRDQFVQLEKLMRLADLVKFAKTAPTPLENESIISIAREFINETFESNKTTNNEE